MYICIQMHGLREDAESLLPNMTIIHGLRFDNLRGDIYGGLTAAVVALPLYVYFVAVTFDGTDVSLTVFIIVKALTYTVGWIALPVVMIGLAPLLGLSSRYVDFIIVTNWGSVLRSALFLPINTLAGFGNASTGFGATLYLATMAAALAYQWFITRTSLPPRVTSCRVTCDPRNPLAPITSLVAAIAVRPPYGLTRRNVSSCGTLRAMVQRVKPRPARVG